LLTLPKSLCLVAMSAWSVCGWCIVCVLSGSARPRQDLCAQPGSESWLLWNSSVCLGKSPMIFLCTSVSFYLYIINLHGCCGHLCKCDVHGEFVEAHSVLQYLLCQSCVLYKLPSVLWDCWLSFRKSIWPVINLSDEVLAWLSILNEVQMICIRSSWCHCHLIISCFIKIQIGLTFLVPAYPGCTWKRPLADV